MCTGNIFIPAKKSPTRTKSVPAKNGIHVFPTIFTLAAGFLVASLNTNLHSEPIDSFGSKGRIHRLLTHMTVPGFTPAAGVMV